MRFRVWDLQVGPDLEATNSLGVPCGLRRMPAIENGARVFACECSIAGLELRGLRVFCACRGPRSLWGMLKDC